MSHELFRESLKSPHALFFKGRCLEAIEFYRERLGAKVQKVIYSKNLLIGGPKQEVGVELAQPRISYAKLRLGSISILAFDCAFNWQEPIQASAIPLVLANDELAQGVFDVLAEEGGVRKSICQTFFSSAYGICVDRFGVNWIVMVGH